MRGHENDLEIRPNVLPLEEINGHIESYPGLDDIFALAPRFPEMDNILFLWEGSRIINSLNNLLCPDES